MNTKQPEVYEMVNKTTVPEPYRGEGFIYKLLRTAVIIVLAYGALGIKKIDDKTCLMFKQQYAICSYKVFKK